MTAVECNSKQKRVHSEFLLSPDVLALSPLHVVECPKIFTPFISLFRFFALFSLEGCKCDSHSLRRLMTSQVSCAV